MSYAKKPVKHNTVFGTFVRNLQTDYIKSQRAGVIIYTLYEGTVYFCLGLDSRTHELTDFGGSVKYKTDKTPVIGALREFDEETLSIFDKIFPEDVADCPVLYDQNNMIIFIYMMVDPESVCKSFNANYKAVIDNGGKSEVCAVTWLTLEDFQTLIKSEKPLYSRVRNFLRRAGDFSRLL